MAKRGRPGKLTKALQKQVCDIIAVIGDKRLAARACGISKTTLYNWLEAGEAEESGKYRDFLDAVEEALDKCEYQHLRKISSSKDWRASVWRLKHMRPEKYAESTRLEHTGRDGEELKPAAATVIIMPDNGRLPKASDGE